MILSEEHVWPTIVSSVIAAGAALSGIAVGSWFTARNQQRERRNARVREQLQGFYSPMLGMRSEIGTKSHIRNKVSSATGAEYVEQFAGVSEPEHKAMIERDMWPLFERVPLYNDEQLRNEIIPLYRKMLDHFSKNLWLAEPSTQEFYPQFCEFVEIWNRFLAGSMPRGVVERLDHSEATLKPFYQDLLSTFERLRKSFAG
ncbi:MAG TPA: hypothetical protein VGG18_16425 [Granulicella sp.]|jgi:hypothetical protein